LAAGDELAAFVFFARGGSVSVIAVNDSYSRRHAVGALWTGRFRS